MSTIALCAYIKEQLKNQQQFVMRIYILSVGSRCNVNERDCEHFAVEFSRKIWMNAHTNIKHSVEQNRWKNDGFE